MRTEIRTYEVYNFNELTEKAQKKAYSHWAEHCNYAWDRENRATLQAFERIFNIKTERWSYDSYTYTYRFTSQYSEKENNLKGTRLLKYLVNNYWEDLYPPKTYWSIKNKKERKSHVFVTDDCVLTGYYIDYDILKPIYDFLKAPNDTTLYELMNKCLDGFFKACSDDMEDQFSEETFAESCEANNYEFLSDGTMFN